MYRYIILKQERLVVRIGTALYAYTVLNLISLLIIKLCKLWDYIIDVIIDVDVISCVYYLAFEDNY
jgi:uncharacterized protein YqhQ